MAPQATTKKEAKGKTAYAPVNPPRQQAAPAVPAPPDPFLYQHTRSFSGDRLKQTLPLCSAVGVHFELAGSDSNRVVVATIAWTRKNNASNDNDAETEIPVWVIHEEGSSIPAFVELMRVLLGDVSVVKIVHGVRPIAHWLTTHGLGASTLEKLMDLQLHYETHVDPNKRDATMASIVKRGGVTLGSYHDAVKSDQLEYTSSFEKHLLPHKVILAVVEKAKLLVACYDKGIATTTSHLERTTLYEMTARRWAYASRHEGNPVIWFDGENDFMPRSLECLGSEEEIDATVPTLELQCEIASLLALLPDRYRDAVLAVDNAHEKLVDINLDIGRVPHGYTGYRERISLGDTASQPVRLLAEGGSELGPLTSTVDADDLNTILERLGGEEKIGKDNRAGVDRQLHRISVMRDKTDAIYGLTMRVGRTLHFASNFLLDLLLSSTHRRKSVLLLGRPGSGKTTLIRDIARCVSESGENVCIIDTSNEIGGDGLVPHECIGWARRMMVKSLNDQARVMVECVQNHTVETLIVDEIGRKAEVNAAGTVRQRGPRMIASAHGDFRSLIKNQDLKGLIGGVQTVIVGDEEAKKNPHLGKTPAKRAGNPIFDVIVEIDEVHRGRCHIIWDVAEAVDAVLNGDAEYACETRFQTFGMRGVQVIQ